MTLSNWENAKYLNNCVCLQFDKAIFSFSYSSPLLLSTFDEVIPLQFHLTK